MWILLGREGEQGGMNVRGWVVSGTGRSVPTEVSPLDRHF